MEVKKKPQADLQRRYPMHLGIGFIISMALVITAFEWRSHGPDTLVNLGHLVPDEEDVFMVPITVPEPPRPKPVVPKEIKIVEDDKEVPEIEVVIDPGEFDDPIEIVEIEAPPAEEAEETEFFIVEHMPAPAEGFEAFYQALGKKLKYPAQARRMGIEGKVYVQFLVDKDGTLTDFKILKGIGAGCDEEALRVLKEVPALESGQAAGQAGEGEDEFARDIQVEVNSYVKYDQVDQGGS